MTIGVGAINANGDIVTATDRMLTMSQGAFSGDQAADKTDILCSNWLVMYAAEDVGVVPPLLRRIQGELLRGDYDEPSVDQMINVLRESFQAERRERASELYLSSFGIALPEFLATGDASLGENLAAIIRERLEQHQLGCELLVVGHDKHPGDGVVHAHILHVRDPGVVKDMSVPGYWTIGTGGYLALSTLVTRQQNARRPLPVMLYNVCEAKFAAEAASGVGKQTFVTIHKADGGWTSLPGKELEKLRGVWERIGRPRSGAPAHVYLETWLQKAQWHQAAPNDDEAGASSDTNSERDQT